MNVRIDESRRQPLRVVLDSQLRTPPEARVINRQGRVLVVGHAMIAADRREGSKRKGVEVPMRCRSTTAGRDLGAVLDLLGQREHQRGLGGSRAPRWPVPSFASGCSMSWSSIWRRRCWGRTRGRCSDLPALAAAG